MTTDSFQPKIQEVILKGKNPKDRDVFCETFVYQPRNIEEMKLGSLFILGRLEKSPEASHILNLLTSIIKREYYFSSKRKPLKSLEESFRKANSALADLTKNGNYSWLSRIDFVCAVLAKNYLHLTKIGKSKIFLLREGELTDIGKRLIPNQDKVHPQKIFQSIASGKIFLHDKIILSTGDMLKHVPSKGLKQIIEINEIDQLEKIMQESKGFATQGMILIETIREKEIPIKAFEPVMLELKAEEKNEKAAVPLINESKFTAAKADLLLFLRNFWQKTRERWKNIKIAVEQQNFNSKIKDAAKTGFSSAKKIVASKDNNSEKQASFEKEKWNLISKNFQPVKNKRLRKKLRKTKLIFRNLPYLTSAALKSSYREFKKDSSPRARILALIFIIAAIAASFGIRYYLVQKYRQEILAEQERSQQLLEKTEQIQKIYRITNPAIINSLPENEKFSRADQQSENFINLSAKLPFSKSEITDSFVYKNNLYILSSANGQIMKCPDFANCQIWTKEDTSLSLAISLAIDGNVYILEKNNLLAQYFNGAKQSSVKIKIRPPLSNNVELLTRPEANNIYILDKQTKRVVLLSKKGELIKQYYLLTLSDIKDFQVSPDEKNIFISADEKIYQIAN